MIVLYQHTVIGCSLGVLGKWIQVWFYLVLTKLTFAVRINALNTK